MSQKLPVHNFELIEDTSEFNEDFIKDYNEEKDEGYFFGIYVKYLKKLHDIHNDLSLLTEKLKIKKVDKLVGNLDDKSVSYAHNKFKTSI